MTNFKVFTLL